MDFFEKIIRYFLPKKEPISKKSSAPKEKPDEPFVPSVYSNSYSYEMNLCTDTATLVLLDPEALPDKSSPDDEEWWIMDFHKLAEIKKGLLAMFRTGADGCYKIRLTNQELTHDEKYFAGWLIPDFGVHVVSGKLFIGGGEDLPYGGEGSGFDLDPNERGQLGSEFIVIPNGDYTVRVFGLDIYDLDDEFTEEEKNTCEGLPEIAIQILPGKATIGRFRDEPSIFIEDSKYFLREKKKKAPKATVEKRSAEVQGGKLYGMTVVFTGKLNKFTRKDAKTTAENHGAKVGSVVNSQTDYLIVGEAPGSKAVMAKELGVKIMTEDEWLECIK